MAEGAVKMDMLAITSKCLISRERGVGTNVKQQGKPVFQGARTMPPIHLEKSVSWMSLTAYLAPSLKIYLMRSMLFRN